MTPFEAWHGRKLFVDHMCIFLVYIKDVSLHPRKVDDDKCIKGYLTYDPMNQRRHVIHEMGLGVQLCYLTL